MKLLFIAFENIESGSSQLERLEYQLTTLSKNNKISILCLNQYDNAYAVKQKYHQITFYHHRIEYNGWNVLNTEEIIKYVKNIDEQNNFDLIIQMMEVWDLLREFSLSFYKTRKFVAIIHAMPFLGAPIKLKKDINTHCEERLKKLDKKSMKYEYIINHYKEVAEVFNKMNVIAANNTVAYYFQHYLKNIEFWTFESFYPQKKETSKTATNSFDFLYMARIEEGKGLEYLEDIFLHLSQKAERKLRIGIAGRIDDHYSKENMEKILALHLNNMEISYLGWVDKAKQQELFSSSKIFLYPSIYDTYSIVLRDAINFGIVAVTWKVPFTLINYRDCPSVKIIPYKDFRKFAEIAMCCLEDKERIALSAKEYIYRQPTEEDICNKDIAIYESIVKKNVYNK